jgi:AcrR family transcriptional regulator
MAPEAQSTVADLATRQRLLDAAGEVFAEQGFRSATVRDICRRAGANVAAVNYHFGDKEKLYQAVIEDAFCQALEKHPPMPAGVTPEAPPEATLGAVIHSFLSRALDEGRPAWQAKLMVREISDPTGALERIVELGVRPQHGLFVALVREILGPDAADADVVLCARSIIGQCLFYRFAHPVVSRLQPGLVNDAQRIRTLAEHVTRFSLAALRGYRPAEDAP